MSLLRDLLIFEIDFVNFNNCFVSKYLILRLNNRNKLYNIFVPMKKILMRCMAMLVALTGMSLSLNAQMAPQPLPMDSAVVYGVLDNGLTYYIRHNEKPKGQADLYCPESWLYT